jgi:hypothetical protein
MGGLRPGTHPCGKKEETMHRRIVPATLSALLLAAVAMVWMAVAEPAAATAQGDRAAASIQSCWIQSQGSSGCCSCNVKRWKVVTCCSSGECFTNYTCLWGTCCGPGTCCA